MLKNPFLKIDQKNARRQSDKMRKGQEFQKITNNGLQTFGIFMILSFVLLSGRLVYIQVNEHENYKVKLEAYNGKKQVITTPRGRMLDANGNVVVDNVENLTVTYYPASGVNDEIEWELAGKIAERFGIKGDNLTQRDLKDLYIKLSDDNANSKLTDEEIQQLYNGELSDSYIYNVKLQRITDEDLSMFSEELLDAYAVKILMNMAPYNEVKTIIEDVSAEDAAYLIEHQSLYPGFDISFDWKREYPYGDSLRSVLGRVSSKKQGVPAEERLYYQALGYSLNERVGTSGIEQEYEFLLNGTHSIYEITVDPNSKQTVLSEVSPGKNGYDLQLTLDMELQNALDEILLDILQREENNQYRPFFEKAYITLMNPSTGDIYAMSSQARIEGTYYDNSSGVYLEAHIPGSVVKGATIYMGLNEGVVQPNEIINDSPIYIKGTAPKASFRNYGPITDIQAIEKSSNVYMFHIAMRLGGANYVPYAPLNINTAAFDLMRNYYSMFGLGTETGLDVPFEGTGFFGSSRDAGLLLDFSIGQYDTYTTLQLAQYAATIANDGYRIAPRLVKRAYETNTDQTVVYDNNIEILSQLSGNLDYLERVQLGFKACVDSGNCGASLVNVNQDVAAKTGTAETTYIHEGKAYSVSNSALIGYAPFDSPKVVFSCVAPNASLNENLQSNICMEIVGKSLEEFFKKY